MRKKFKYPINHVAVLLAALSFAVGTVVFVAFKLTGEFGLMVIGYYHILGAAAVNTFMLLLLLIHATMHVKDYKESLLTSVVVVMNIPITALYLQLL